MSENSKIEWTDHTYNAWVGCTKVSPGCANCYAEKSTRARVLRAAGSETWGKGAERSRTKTDRDPLRWNWQGIMICPDCGGDLKARLQKGSGIPLTCKMCQCGSKNPPTTKRRPRVFCASLSDWLDDEVPIEWLADLLQLIAATPNLDWLMLTKRPENWYRRVSLASGEMAESWIDCIDMPDRGTIPENVWIGTTAEDQTRADERIPHLLAIPAKVRFLSCEPLLTPLNLNFRKRSFGFPSHIDALGHAHNMPQGIHWVICGGESGSGCRPMDLEWARSLRDQCQTAGVPFFMKQTGGTRKPFPEIPPDLMIRQFPA